MIQTTQLSFFFIADFYVFS